MCDALQSTYPLFFFIFFISYFFVFNYLLFIYHLKSKMYNKNKQTNQNSITTSTTNISSLHVNPIKWSINKITDEKKCYTQCMIFVLFCFSIHIINIMLSNLYICNKLMVFNGFSVFILSITTER